TLAADSSRVTLGAALRLTAAVSGLNGGAPTGTVSFNAGGKLLGGAQLTASGKSMTATLSVSTSRLPYGANTVTAIYGGDRSFNGSSASITIDAGLPIAESAVVPSITPVPVFESPLTANLWSYTVKLTEAAGVATVITDYTIDGISQIEQLTTAFGGATLPARGSLSANLTLTNLNAPVTVVFGFSGVDASGRQWSQQLPVPFYPFLRGRR